MSNLNIKNKTKKNSTVYTPSLLSKTIYNIVKSKYDFDTILDPCIGGGSLIENFYDESYILGIDLENTLVGDEFIRGDIEEVKFNFSRKPDIIIMNPPFNGHSKRKLYPEIFLKKIFSQYGEDIPVIMITGDNFLNNNRLNSKRLTYISQSSFEITSIMTLPLDIFENVLFNTQVLFFNLPLLKPYYIFDFVKEYQKEVSSNLSLAA